MTRMYVHCPIVFLLILYSHLCQPLGFHLSDGTVYTYLQGDEYEDIEAAWDWNCKLFHASFHSIRRDESTSS